MKTFFRSLCIVPVVSLALASVAHAQSPVQAQLQIKKEVLLEEVRGLKTKKAQVQANTLTSGTSLELYLLSIAFAQPRGTAVARELAKVVETARVDKQLGSGSSASGSTSVTEKGAVPEILAFAVENGALTKSQSGTTISFKGNPVGIVNSLIANSLPPTGPLSRLAFGLEFDASRGSDESQAPVFEGDPQQLSAFSVKYEILNHRDPDSRQFQERAEALYSQATDSSTTSTRALNQTLLGFETNFTMIMTEPAHRAAFNGWAAAAAMALDAAPEEQLMKVLDEQLALLSAQVPFTTEELASFDKYVEFYGKLLDSRDALLELAGKGAVMSIEYLNSRPVDQPTESTFKWLYEWSALDGHMDITANASTTVLNGTIPDGTERLKAWAIAGQADFPLGSIRQGRTLIFSLSGRAEGLVVAPTSERETIWLGQAKVTFPVKDAGMKLPLSITVASRTDLIDETVVRGNIGLTFNLDSLLGM
jgi:hypothetical protein